MTALVIPTDAPAVPGPSQGHWTHADWETLPDDGNCYEIIDGVLYMSTAPSHFHQWIDFMLVKHIGIPAYDQGLALPAFAPVGVIMPGCDPVQPDFVLVLTANKAIIHDRRIRGVPDLIVEILSPSNKDYDLSTKLDAYARAGLPEYAIVDPRERTLSHYRIEAPGRYAAPRVYGETETARFACLPAIAFRVGQLFEGAPDTTL